LHARFFYFMGPVAERLFGGFPAGAPPVFAGLHVHDIRSFLYRHKILL